MSVVSIFHYSQHMYQYHSCNMFRRLQYENTTHNHGSSTRYNWLISSPLRPHSAAARRSVPCARPPRWSRKRDSCPGHTSRGAPCSRRCAFRYNRLVSWPLAGPLLGDDIFQTRDTSYYLYYCSFNRVYETGTQHSEKIAFWWCTRTMLKSNFAVEWKLLIWQ